jgi:hypothetical protein
MFNLKVYNMSQSAVAPLTDALPLISFGLIVKCRLSPAFLKIFNFVLVIGGEGIHQHAKNYGPNEKIIIPPP